MLSFLRKIKRYVQRVRLISSITSKESNFPLIDKESMMTLMDGHPYIHDDEIRLLANIVSKIDGPIVEIGCAFGASSSILLLHSKDNTKIHSIDPFTQDSMRDFRAEENICRKNVLNLLKIFKKVHRYHDWILHIDYSFNVVKGWTEPIEMIFIDGDHNYDAVKKDYEDWFPFVKKGGYIAFHDSRKEEGTPEDTFNRGWAGPTKFVDELRKSDKVSFSNEAFSVTVWQKK